MKGFIIGSSAISLQHTFDRATYLASWEANGSGQILEPDYAEWIDPRLTRRMSRVIRMGLATALSSLQEASVEKPGAIVVGTNLGCTADTEKFLKELVETEEGILSPTAFIQSTHNTIAGQMALMLHCDAYNMTHSNLGHSFENALKDALLLLHEDHDHILVGGIDEAIPTARVIHDKIQVENGISIHKNDPIGEGSAFFVMSKSSKHEGIFVQDLWIGNELKTREIPVQTSAFLKANNLIHSEIDALIIGQFADDEIEQNQAFRSNFNQSTVVVPLHEISGSFSTNSAIALNLAYEMLKNQVCFGVGINEQSKSSRIRNILIYNFRPNDQHSLILVSR